MGSIVSAIFGGGDQGGSTPPAAPAPEPIQYTPAPAPVVPTYEDSSKKTEDAMAKLYDKSRKAKSLTRKVEDPTSLGEPDMTAIGGTKSTLG